LLLSPQAPHRIGKCSGIPLFLSLLNVIHAAIFRSGIRCGDVLLSVNSASVHDFGDSREMLAYMKAQVAHLQYLNCNRAMPNFFAAVRTGTAVSANRTKHELSRSPLHPRAELNAKRRRGQRCRARCVFQRPACLRIA
jgi:hypothetical protein